MLSESPKCTPILRIDIANQIVHICAHARNAVRIMNAYKELNFETSHGLCGTHLQEDMLKAEAELYEAV